jgi:hypothetical protein
MSRIQFEVSENRRDKIDELQAKLKLSTRKALFNNALALLRWAVEQKENGRKIASLSEEENSYMELVMPALEDVETRVSA